MRKKRSLHKNHHVLTVRFLDEEWQHFQAVQANLAKKERRHVTYNEIIVGQVMELPRRG